MKGLHVACWACNTRDMNTTSTTTQTFTTADLEAFAQLVRPFLGTAVTARTLEAAATEAREASERNTLRFLAAPQFAADITGHLAGTYDEFRAEASR